MFRSVFGVIAALLVTTASTANATPAVGSPPTLEQRLAAAQLKLGEIARMASPDRPQGPDAEKDTQVAQHWHNHHWHNWNNWNDWRNWGNWGNHHHHHR